MADNNVSFVITAQDRATAALKSIADAVKKLGVTLLALKAGSAFSDVFDEAVQKAAEVEKQFDVLQSASSATAQELEALRNKASELAASTDLSVTTLGAAQAMTELVKSGLSAQQTLEAITPVIALAQGAQIDFGTAAGYVTANLATFQMQAEDAGRVADVLTAAANATKTSVTQLADALSYAGPSAKAAGVSFEETTAIIALMQNAGIDGSRAGTALNSMLADLMSPASTASQALDKVGIHTRDFVTVLAELERMGPAAQSAILAFGKEAGPALQAVLSQGSGAIHALNADLLNASGTAIDAAKIMMDNYAGAKEALDGVVGSMKTSIGSALLEPLTEKVRHTTEILAEFAASSTFEAIKQAIVGIVTTSISAMNGVMSFITSVASGIASVVNSAAFQALITVLGTVATAAASAFSSLASSAWQGIAQGFTQAATTIRTALSGIGFERTTQQFDSFNKESQGSSSSFQSTAERIKASVSAIVQAIATLAAGFIAPAWSAIVATLQNVGSAIAEWVQSIDFNRLVAGAASAGEALGRLTVAFFNLTRSIATPVLNAALSVLKGFGAAISQSLRTIDVRAVIDTLASQFSNASAAFSNAFKSVFGGINNALKQAFNGFNLTTVIQRLVTGFDAASVALKRLVTQDGLEQLQQKITQVSLAVFKLAQHFASPAFKLAGAVFQQITDHLNGLTIEGITAQFQKLGDALRAMGVGGAFETLKSWIASIGASISSISFDAITTKIANFKAQLATIASTDAFVGYKTTIGDLGHSISAVIPSVGNLSTAFDLLNLGLSPVTFAFNALINLFYAAKSAVNATLGGIATVLTWVASSFNAVAQGVGIWADIFNQLDFIPEPIKRFAASVKESLNEVGDSITGAKQTLQDFADSNFRAMEDAANKAGAAKDRAGDNLRSFGASIVRLGSDFVAATVKTKEFSNAHEQLLNSDKTAKAKVLSDAIAAYSRALQDSNQGSATAKAQLESLKTAVDNAQQAYDQAGTAVDQYREKYAQAQQVLVAFADVSQRYQTALKQAAQGDISAYASLDHLGTQVETVRTYYVQLMGEINNTSGVMTQSANATRIASDAQQQSTTTAQANIAAQQQTASITQANTVARQQSTATTQANTAAQQQYGNVQRDVSVAVQSATNAQHQNTSATHENTTAFQQMGAALPNIVAQVKAFQQEYEKLLAKSKVSKDFGQINLNYQPLVAQLRDLAAQLQTVKFDQLNTDEIKAYLTAAKIAFENSAIPLTRYKELLHEASVRGVSLSDALKVQNASTLVYSGSIAAIAQKINDLTAQFKRGELTMSQYRQAIRELNTAQNTLKNVDLSQSVKNMTDAWKAAKTFSQSFNEIQSIKVQVSGLPQVNTELKQVSDSAAKTTQSMNQFGEKTISSTHNLSPALNEVVGKIKTLHESLQYFGTSNVKILPDNMVGDAQKLKEELDKISTVNLNTDELRAYTEAYRQLMMMSNKSAVRENISEWDQYGQALSKAAQNGAGITNVISMQAQQLEALRTKLQSARTLLADFQKPQVTGEFTIVSTEKIEQQKQLIKDLEAQIDKVSKSIAASSNASSAAVSLANEKMTASSSAAAAKGLQLVQDGVDKKASEYQRDLAAFIDVQMGLVERVKDSATKQYEAVKTGEAKIENVYKTVEQAKLNTLKQIETKYKTHIDALLAEEKKYKDEVTKVQKEIEKLRLTGEERLRELKRGAMSEEQARADRILEIEQNLQKAREALSAGDTDKAKEFAKKAEDASANVAVAVEKDGKTIISQQQANAEAVKLMTDALKLQEAALEQTRAKAQGNADLTTTAIEAAKSSFEKIKQALDDSGGSEHKITSNVDELVADIEKKLKGKKTEGEHTVTTNAEQVAQQVNEQLNGQKTESTHTVKVDDAEAKIAELNGMETTSTHTVKANISQAVAAINSLKKDTSSRHTVYVTKVETHATGGIVGQFATGGAIPRFQEATWHTVPGVGDRDTVPAALPVGGFVLRKRAVNYYGTSFLDRLHHFASGGHVPAMVTPGERLYQPQTVSRVGVGFFEALNSLRFPKDVILNGVDQLLAPVHQFNEGGAVTANNTAETVNINLSVGRQTIKMQSSRDQADTLASALRDLSRGR